MGPKVKIDYHTCPLRNVAWLNPAKDIPYDATIALMGARKCGKTTAWYHLMAAIALSRGIVMCPTPEIYNTYARFMPKSSLYQAFDEERLVEILMKQKRLSEHIADDTDLLTKRLMADYHKAGKALRKQSEENLLRESVLRNWNAEEIQSQFDQMEIQIKQRETAMEAAVAKQVDEYFHQRRRDDAIFIGLDDLGSDGSLGKKIVKTMMNNGRHYLSLVAMLLQDVIDLPPRCRSGLDFCFLFPDYRPNVLDTISKKFASLNVTLLERYMRKAQELGAILVVRRNHPNPTFENSVFFFKSSRIPMEPKKLGSAEFWAAEEMFLDQARLKHYKRTAGVIMSEEKSKKKGKKGAKGGEEKEEIKPTRTHRKEPPARPVASQKQKQDQQQGEQEEQQSPPPVLTTAMNNNDNHKNGKKKNSNKNKKNDGPSLLSPNTLASYDAMIQQQRRQEKETQTARKHQHNAVVLPDILPEVIPELPEDEESLHNDMQKPQEEMPQEQDHNVSDYNHFLLTQQVINMRASVRNGAKVAAQKARKRDEKAKEKMLINPHAIVANKPIVKWPSKKANNSLAPVRALRRAVAE